MIERRFTGAKPRVALPKGAVDTQLHVYLPGFLAQPRGDRPCLKVGQDWSNTGRSWTG